MSLPKRKTGEAALPGVSSYRRIMPRSMRAPRITTRTAATRAATATTSVTTADQLVAVTMAAYASISISLDVSRHHQAGIGVCPVTWPEGLQSNRWKPRGARNTHSIFERPQTLPDADHVER